jgi:hypothetical protein
LHGREIPSGDWSPQFVPVEAAKESPATEIGSTRRCDDVTMRSMELKSPLRDLTTDLRQIRNDLKFRP